MAAGAHAQDNQLILRADSLLEARQFDEAAAIYDRLLSEASRPAQRAAWLLKLGNCAFQPGDFRTARTQYQLALRAALESGDAELTNRSRHAFGRSLSRLAEYDEAKKQLGMALAAYRKQGARAIAETSECLGDLSFVHLLLDELRESEECALDAANLLQQQPQPDQLKAANIYNLLGNIYKRMGRNDDADAYYLKCMKIREAELPYPNIALGGVYYNYGVFLTYLGRTSEAMAYSQKALDNYKAIDPDHPRVGDAYLSIGQKYVEFGDYRAGRDCFLESLRIFRKAFGEKQERVGTIYNLLGNIYRLNGDFEQARIYVERGLEITRSVLGPDHDRIASALTTVGDIEADAGNYPLALDAYRRALEIRRKILGDDNPNTAFLYFLTGQASREAGLPREGLPYLQHALKIYGDSDMGESEDMANVCASLGLTYLDLAEYAVSLSYLRKDLVILRQLYGNTHPYLADSYSNEGLWFERQGRLDSALYYYHEAMRAMSLDFDEKDIYATPGLTGIMLPYQFLDILKMKGDAFAERASGTKDLEAALDCYRRGGELIDRLRSQYRSQGAKLFFQQKADPLFAAGFRTAWRLYEQTNDRRQAEAAFWFAERSKAGLLTAALQGVADRPFAGVPDSLRLHAENLRSRISGAEQQVNDERLWPSDSTGRQLSLLKSRQTALQSSFDSLLAVLENRFPAFYQLNYGTATASLAAIQHKIPDKRTAVLEYFLTNDRLYTFTITRSDVNLSAADRPQSLDEDIAYLRSPPDRTLWLREPDKAAADYLSRSHRLFGILIGQYLDVSRYDRLVVIPHGILSYMPFEGLSSDEGVDFRQADFLVRRCAVQYANSATLWAADRENRSGREKKLLGMAPAYGNALAQTNIAQDLNFRGSLGPLKFNETEISQAAEYFPGSILLNGAAATELAFKENAPDAAILHLAMHALVSDSLPMQSRLIFAPGQDTLEDGLLHAYELYNMKLPAEMAVLSACNTGFGRLAAGEGVMSLAHAFRYAGCKSIIMSLWPAEDEGTAKIIARFYAHLADGLPKDEALRLARLDYLGQADLMHAHPYYWAHLVAVGDMAPLRKSRSIPVWGWILAALALAAAVRIFRVRKS